MSVTVYLRCTLDEAENASHLLLLWLMNLGQQEPQMTLSPCHHSSQGKINLTCRARELYCGVIPVNLVDSISQVIQWVKRTS
ncbi:hypothetical protein CEXT_589731 [Caerostris extrusa]|uniref:Uncharacterized protein n=1 Tax=Caerostris extrusa TaxID=172846 RepID=A0AAV4NXZ2_CAEEX|nr:hypothetical protein CEXT_589731 [Caerostris extrusa]